MLQFISNSYFLHINTFRISRLSPPFLHLNNPPESAIITWNENHGNMAGSGGFCAGRHLGEQMMQSLPLNIKRQQFQRCFTQWEKFWTSVFFYVIYQCRDIHQIPVPSIPLTAHELWCVSLPIGRSVSVYFSTEFNFTGSFLDLYLYIICIKETEKLWTVIRQHIRV
jgi:hypothetical protein